MESTFIILKPDAIRRKLVGQIISRIEYSNLSVAHVKMMHITREQANEHYRHVKRLGFFGEMVDYIISCPVMVLVVKGENALQVMRSMAGSAENPEKGTIRGDFGIRGYENLIHTSDSKESYMEEVRRFFPELFRQYKNVHYDFTRDTHQPIQ